MRWDPADEHKDPQSVMVILEQENRKLRAEGGPPS